jgi:general secretion pathway protein C
MVNNLPNSWTVRGATLVLWAAAAASVAYWALKLTAAPATGPMPTPVRQVPPPDPAAVARLLGFSQAAPTMAAAPSAASRFSLVGVVAGASGGGAALIAVDGKPAKPFRVGASLDDGLVLQSVEGRRARLGPRPDGPSTVTLDLPLQPK